MILFFGWLLDGASARQPALFDALVLTGCIGFAALLNALIADPVERLRVRLRAGGRGGPVRRSEARGKPARRVAPAAREPYSPRALIYAASTCSIWRFSWVLRRA